MTGANDPSTPVRVTRRGAAAWLALNRPAAMNALTAELMTQLGAELAGLRSDQAVRCIVLTGEGRSFCAGVDLMSLGANRTLEQTFKAFLDVAAPVVSELERFPKPVVAAVDGVALAGGLELVLACDIVYASTRAGFGDAHANFGLIPGGGSSAKLPRRIGISAAKELIFTGRTVDAETMMALGLVNKVVAPEALQQAVDELTALLAERSPIGLARSKALIDEGWDLPLASAVQREAVAAVEHCRTDDAKEGIAAFASKRKPVFVGR